MKKIVFNFSIGFLIGLGLMALSFILPNNFPFPTILLAGGKLINLTDITLYHLCALFNSSRCAGLGLDGSSLQWIEILSMFVGVGSQYGILWCLFKTGVDFLKTKLY